MVRDIPRVILDEDNIWSSVKRNKMYIVKRILLDNFPSALISILELQVSSNLGRKDNLYL